MALTLLVSTTLLLIVYHIKVITHYKLIRLIQNPNEDKDTDFFWDFYAKRRNSDFDGIMSIFLIQETLGDPYQEQLKRKVNTWIIITRWFLIILLILIIILLIQDRILTRL